jgi:hypothetical protein
MAKSSSGPLHFRLWDERDAGLAFSTDSAIYITEEIHKPRG